MDPAALIARIFVLNQRSMEYIDGLQDLTDWYLKGGYRPTVNSVIELLHRQSALDDEIRDFMYSVNNEILVKRLTHFYRCTNET